MIFKNLSNKIIFQFILYSIFISFIPTFIIYGNLYFYLIEPIIQFIDKTHQNLKFLFQERLPIKKSELSMSKLLDELEMTKQDIENLTQYIQNSTLIIIGILILLILCLSLIIILNKVKFLKEISRTIEQISNNNFSQIPHSFEKTEELVHIKKKLSTLFFLEKKQDLLIHITFEEMLQQLNQLNFKNIKIIQNNSKQNLSFKFFLYPLGFGKLSIIFIECIELNFSSEKLNEQILKLFWISTFSFLRNKISEKLSLENLIQELNKYLSKFMQENHFYFNVFFSNLDLTLYHLEFINVGFQGALHFDDKKNIAQILIHKDILLPFGKADNFLTYKIKINSQDRLLFYDSNKIILIKKDAYYKLFLTGEDKALIYEKKLNVFFHKLEKIIQNGQLENHIFIINLK